RAFVRGMDDPAGAVSSDTVDMVIRSSTFEDLFEAERPRLFRILLLVTRDYAEAEEIMQEAFVRIWERWDRVSGLEDPRGYLYRTAFNLHRSAARRALVAARRIVRPAVVPDPYEEVAQRDEVLRELARLTPRQRAAVVVTELLGYPSDEAAVMLGVRPGTVRTLTSQARSALATR